VKVWSSRDLDAAGFTALDIPIGDIFIASPEAMLRVDPNHTTGHAYWQNLTASHLAFLLRDILLKLEEIDEGLEYVRKSFGLAEEVEL
jgi:hypothetical protein